MHEATRYILDHAEELRAEAVPSDELGRLTDRTVEILRASGGMRLLQAKDFGGFEAHPNEFLDWVMAGRHEPPLGGLDRRRRRGPPVGDRDRATRRLQEEVFGDRPRDVSSPRRTRRSVGPSRSTAASGSPGRWPYSTGTDHADWVILGGMVADAAGAAGATARRTPLRAARVRDYEIVEDTWNVMGLAGTG